MNRVSPYLRPSSFSSFSTLFVHPSFLTLHCHCQCHFFPLSLLLSRFEFEVEVEVEVQGTEDSFSFLELEPRLGKSIEEGLNTEGTETETGTEGGTGVVAEEEGGGGCVCGVM